MQCDNCLRACEEARVNLLQVDKNMPMLTRFWWYHLNGVEFVLNSVHFCRFMGWDAMGINIAP